MYEEKPTLDAFQIPRDRSKISYKLVNEKIFIPHCVACHGPAAGVSVETYAAVKQNLARIEAAVLKFKFMPPKGPLSSLEYELLDAWIRAGAPENADATPPSSLLYGEEFEDLGTAVDDTL